MSHITIDHPLDWGRHYRLIFDYHPDRRKLLGVILGPIGSSGEVERHLVTLVSLSAAGQTFRFQYQPPQPPHLSVDLPPAASGGLTLDIRLGGSSVREGELFGRYRVMGDSVEYHEIFQRLTVFETRMLGNERLYRWLPYPRHQLSPTYLRTDLHTHSSGQISAAGLLEVAMRHNIPYPTRLLDVLGIPYPKGNTCRTTRFFFPPTDAAEIGRIPKEEDAVPLHALSDPALDALCAAMSVPPDRQVTFGDLEVTVYRYRTPISKHPAVARDLLLKTAQEYAQQGVVYAEITATSTSLLLPEYLSLLHSEMPGIEAETGVKLRFLVGLPRNLPAAMLHREVEKLKLMGASPYIVGVDFMGFEDNKIGDLEPYMLSIAEWAQQHDPEFTLRIHAGENRKNLTNVRESLRLAQKFNMRVRIGHAAHGLDAEAVDIAEALAQNKLCMIEFNPDSNLALNNIDTAEELEITTCITRDIPFVICSDGGGLYQTDVRQLEAAASFAGVGANHVATLVLHEREHMAREAVRFTHKREMLPPDFLARIAQDFRTLQETPHAAPDNRAAITAAFESHLTSHGIRFSPESIRQAVQGKKPLLILGATGAQYWARITPAHQEQIAQVVSGLVEALAPQASYFLIGRPKNAGLTPLLSTAVQTHNAGYDAAQHFSLVSATVQADQTTQSFTPGLTHVLPLQGSLFTVPQQLVGYVAAQHGIVVFIGGGTFVRDAILVARDRGVAFALMKGVEGASQDKSGMMDPKRHFSDLQGLLDIIRRQQPDMLR